jgi:hypothetical protein
MTSHEEMDTNLMKEPGNNGWSHLSPAPVGSHVHEMRSRGWSAILLSSHHYVDVQVSNTCRAESLREHLLATIFVDSAAGWQAQ